MVMEVNQAACAFQGIPREKLIGMSVEQLVPADWRLKVSENFKHWWDGSHTYFKGMTLRGDGTKILVEVYGTRIVFKGRQAILLHVQDISTSAHHRHLAVTRETLLNDALEQIGSVVYRRNFDEDTFEFIGPGMKQLSGLTLTGLTPSMWDKLATRVEMLGDAAGSPPERIRRDFESGLREKWFAELTIETPDGEAKRILDVASILRTPLGKVTGCIGVLMEKPG